MTRVRALQLLVVTALSAWLSWRAHFTPDYFIDAGPPIDALIHGRFSDFLHERPVMGPLSLILRAPFALLSRITGNGGPLNGYEAAYQFGIFPCVFAAGLFGMGLAELLRRAGRPWPYQWLALILCLVNPVSARALALGHPEEILGAVLLAAGMLAAVFGRAGAAAGGVALALLTKQWALFGVLPTAIVVGWQRIKRPLAVGLAVCVVAAIPLIAANPSSLLDANLGQFDIKYESVQPASVWWPFTEEGHVPGRPGFHKLTPFLRHGARPLILAIGLLLPLLLARRVRQDPWERALPLLALVLLVRCFMDPVNNGYYHVPFFMALIAADALTGRMIPTLVAVAGLELLTRIAKHADAALLSAFYLGWALPFALYLAGRAYGVDWSSLLRSRGVRGLGAERRVRSSSSAARTQ
jgi:hypothetical protein